MKTIYRLEDFSPCDLPISLTIGNFDGVHKGHQAILCKLKNRKVVFTFSNHPSEILKNKPVPYLTTLIHRLKLLSEQAIDTSIVISFTKKFSKQSPEDFLITLRKYVPFSHLVLGEDAALGHKQQGTPSILRPLSQKLGFSLEYVEPVTINHCQVSSSGIRKQIQEGNFEKAAELLGRPFSMMAQVESGEKKGRLLGFKTANLKIDHLCLPPLGVYIIKAIIFNKSYLGVANLGYAPTLHRNEYPLLEVHLLDYQEEIYDETLEVIFLKFLRPEKRFASSIALKQQIQHDIEIALNYGERG